MWKQSIHQNFKQLIQYCRKILNQRRRLYGMGRFQNFASFSFGGHSTDLRLHQFFSVAKQIVQMQISGQHGGIESQHATEQMFFSVDPNSFGTSIL